MVCCNLSIIKVESMINLDENDIVLIISDYISTFVQEKNYKKYSVINTAWYVYLQKEVMVNIPNFCM